MKMQQYATIDEYMAQFPQSTQEILVKIRQIVQEAAPEAREKIAYGIPTLTLNGPLVHFAAYEKHVGFYPGPNGIGAFQTELAPYETSKGTIRFPLDKPIPYDLIRKITLFRVQQNLDKRK